MAKKKVHASRKAAGKSANKKKHSKPVKSKPRTAKGAAGAKGRAVAAVSPDLAPSVAENVRWVHALLDKMIDTFPADKATYQVAGTDNHLLWTVGHLALTYAWFASMLGGAAPAAPESYPGLFGYQTKPTGDAGAYPSLEEVRGQYRASFESFVRAMAALAPADLLKPPVGESHGFAATRADVLIRAAWHDGWHAGQLSTLRRAMGLPPVM